MVNNMAIQQKPYTVKLSEIVPQWHVLDARDKTLGRLSSEIALLLMGKNKPTYQPHQNTGDYVVVVNAGKVKVTGQKAAQMKYYRHSGYPGGLQERTFEQVLRKDPKRILHNAIRGMLPKNYLARKMLSRLKLVLEESPDRYKAQIVGAQRAAEKAARALIENKPTKAKVVKTKTRKKIETEDKSPIKLAKPRAIKAAEMKRNKTAETQTESTSEMDATAGVAKTPTAKGRVAVKSKGAAKIKPKSRAKSKSADTNEEA